MRRRDILLAAATLISAVGSASRMFAQRRDEMFGLIGKMAVADGKRDELMAILLEASANMPGCLSYIVASDASDANAIWITEVWDSKASHEASLALPSVKEAIVRGRPLIVSFGDRVVTTPVGGHGLTRLSSH
jgi:quinol monooxygenase YgiN